MKFGEIWCFGGKKKKKPQLVPNLSENTRIKKSYLIIKICLSRSFNVLGRHQRSIKMIKIVVVAVK